MKDSPPGRGEGRQKFGVARAQGPVAAMTMAITVELLGGLEYLAKHRASLHSIQIQHSLFLDDVYQLVAGKVLARHGDVFFQRGDIAPGIIVLVNDVDKETLARDVKIGDGDRVTFISMIHGG